MSAASSFQWLREFVVNEAAESQNSHVSVDGLFKHFLAVSSRVAILTLVGKKATAVTSRLV